LQFDLYARQVEILDLLSQRDSNKLIPRKISLLSHTVKWHVANILEKSAGNLS